MIHASELLLVLCRLLSHLNLRGHRRNALLTGRCKFGWQRTACHASRSGEAGSAGRVRNGRVINDCVRHRAVVHLYIGDSDVVDRTVVIELVSAPVPALISNPRVTVAIINPAVIADVRSPISIVIAIPAAHKPPIAGSP